MTSVNNGYRRAPAPADVRNHGERCDREIGEDRRTDQRRGGIECRDQKQRIVDTELFGPVLCVLRFRQEDEVVRLANDSRHGLAAGVFTKDGARSLRITKKLRAGIVWVNTYRVVSPIAEFGGFNESGYGRESGLQAIYDYTRPKTVWINTSDQPLANPFVMR